MVRQVKVEILADASRYTRGMRDAQRTTQGFNQHTDRAGKALRTAFTAFSAGAVVVGLKQAVDAASSMNETASKTRVVFGPAAQGVEDFAKRAATAMGLSRQEAMESAATFGNLFVSMKIGAPRAAEMSTKMVKLAGDLASFNNANPQETLEALRSGLVGETEPLRKFGINLNDADLRQKALALGLTKTTKNVLPPAVKAQAAYALILEQSKTAQGDFARTSGGLANQQRILAAQWKDMQATIGSVLLPTVLKGVGAFNDFLGVVDRNRKAFGVLFGVLGAGAVILGTLIVATKIHKAVTEGVTAVTETWTAVQKGLNLTLGVTETRAVAATAAEGGLATATTGAGAAAVTASAGFATLATRLGLVGAAVAAGAYSGSQFDDQLQKIHKSTNPLAKAIDWLNQKTTIHIGKNKEAASSTQRQTAATHAQTPALQEAAAATAENAKKATELSAKLKDLRGQFRQTREAVAQTIESYDGLISQSKVTAAQVIKDLHNQVANFRTYSADTRRLIKAGVDPAAIRELSQKGPQYIHALATGSARQLQDYKATWMARNKEVNGDFARSMEAQYQGLVKKIRAMQRQIDALHGKNIPVSASLRLNFTKDYTQAMWAADRARAGRMASGGIVQGPGTGQSDSIPRWLSKGEYVVNADSTSRYLPYLEWMNAKRMALGGPVGRIDAQSRSVNKIEAFGTGTRLHAGIAAFLAAFGAGNGAAGGFSGGAASGNVIRLALAQAKQMAASFKVALALIEAGIVESGLRNLNYGDRDSLGFLQQRPSQGWLHPMNISYAAWDFLRRAIPIAGNYGTAGQLAQAVQRSAFPARYDAVQARALGILKAYGYDRGGALPPGLSLAYNGTGRPEPVGGRVVLEVRSGGSRLDDVLVEVLRRAVRARGGNVQGVLGT